MLCAVFGYGEAACYLHPIPVLGGRTATSACGGICLNAVLMDVCLAPVIDNLVPASAFAGHVERYRRGCMPHDIAAHRGLLTDIGAAPYDGRALRRCGSRRGRVLLDLIDVEVLRVEVKRLMDLVAAECVYPSIGEQIALALLAVDPCVFELGFARLRFLVYLGVLFGFPISRDLRFGRGSHFAHRLADPIVYLVIIIENAEPQAAENIKPILVLEASGFVTIVVRQPRLSFVACSGIYHGYLHTLRPHYERMVGYRGGRLKEPQTVYLIIGVVVHIVLALIGRAFDYAARRGDIHVHRIRRAGKVNRRRVACEVHAAKRAVRADVGVRTRRLTIVMFHSNLPSHSGSSILTHTAGTRFASSVSYISR